MTKEEKRSQRPRLPKEFTSGMKKFGGEFLNGVWDGMSPGRKADKNKRRKGG